MISFNRTLSTHVWRPATFTMWVPQNKFQEMLGTYNNTSPLKNTKWHVVVKWSSSVKMMLMLRLKLALLTHVSMTTSVKGLVTVSSTAQLNLKPLFLPWLTVVSSTGWEWNSSVVQVKNCNILNIMPPKSSTYMMEEVSILFGRSKRIMCLQALKCRHNLNLWNQIFVWNHKTIRS